MAKLLYQEATELRSIKRVLHQDSANLRNIKKGYYQNGSDLRLVFSSGAEFSYTGTYDLVGDLASSWVLYLRSSGVLTFFNYGGTTDLFMVGPGGDGGSGSEYRYGSSIDARGGAGGNGGQIITQLSQNFEGNYDIILSTGETKFGDITASKGGGAAGGSGSYAATYVGSDHGKPGSDGFYAFDDSSIDGIKYGPGGGSGGARASGGAGGATGGGNGGASMNAGQNGQGIGAGGGGGGSGNLPEYGDVRPQGGTGSVGIVILRGRSN